MQKIYIVFDFDGTLADTQKHHAQIESNFLKSYGIDLDPIYISATYAGRTPREWLAEVLAENGLQLDEHILEQFELHKNERVVALAKGGEIALLPGVQEFLTKAKQDDSIIMGISSGTSVAALQELIPYFALDIKYYTSADEVVHKKPAPDVFNKTFEKMGAPIDAKKIVVGDGISDILGGKAAGAKTIFVNANPEKGKLAGADLVIQSFEELSREVVCGL